jgi:hypothetical protein
MRTYTDPRNGPARFQTPLAQNPQGPIGVGSPVNTGWVQRSFKASEL